MTMGAYLDSQGVDTLQECRHRKVVSVWVDTQIFCSDRCPQLQKNKAVTCIAWENIVDLRMFLPRNHREAVDKWLCMCDSETQRCQPCVTYSEYRGDELYHECKSSAPIPWENMIRR
ncbi:hypothetical protein CGCFRS4_v015810 [Colletotrichum fructicola]|nr:hypothetical protein CGCFRS4_v015810 [Colletotrichum fructicola]